MYRSNRRMRENSAQNSQHDRPCSCLLLGLLYYTLPPPAAQSERATHPHAAVIIMPTAHAPSFHPTTPAACALIRHPTCPLVCFVSLAWPSSSRPHGVICPASASPLASPTCARVISPLPARTMLPCLTRPLPTPSLVDATTPSSLHLPAIGLCVSQDATNTAALARPCTDCCSHYRAAGFPPDCRMSLCASFFVHLLLLATCLQCPPFSSPPANFARPLLPTYARDNQCTQKYIFFFVKDLIKTIL